jgi:hypothetical protein
VRERAAALAAHSGKLSRVATRALVGKLWKQPRFARSVLDMREAIARSGR